MKTLGRILIILAVFSALTGLMVTAVNASGANAPGGFDAPRFRPDGDEFMPDGDGNRPERHEREMGGFGGFGILFSIIKNTIVIGILVAVIVVPKNIVKQKKRTPKAGSESDEPVD